MLFQLMSSQTFDSSDKLTNEKQEMFAPIWQSFKNLHFSLVYSKPGISMAVFKYTQQLLFVLQSHRLTEKASSSFRLYSELKLFFVRTYFDYLPPVVVCRLAALGQFVVYAVEELHKDEGVAFAFHRYLPHYVDYLLPLV